MADPYCTQFDYKDFSWELRCSDGSYYSENVDGSWYWADASGFNCSGAADGSWCCSDGSCGGDWQASPAASVKRQAAQLTASAAPNPNPVTPLPQPQPPKTDFTMWILLGAVVILGLRGK